MATPLPALGIALFSVAGLAACTAAPPPSRVFPQCDTAIDESAVQVLDLRDTGLDGDGLAQYLAGAVGDYRIFSKQPIAVGKGQRKRARWNPTLREHPDAPEGIGRSISEAAKHGCDLVLVVGSVRVPTGGGSPTNSAGFTEKWLVHFGETVD